MSTSNMEPPFPSLTQTWHKTSYDAISPTRHELSVANKTVIVTGGGRGLGAEMARAFAAAGASRVVLIGRTQTTLSQTAENIEKEFASVSVSTYAAHVADEDAMGKVAEKVKKWDVLILNAGLLAGPKPIETANVTDWWRVFETNVKGAMVTARAFLPSRSPNASIVGISANLMTVPASSPYAAGASAYCCSKFAQAKMLEYLAVEHPDVFVVSAHPGCVETDMLKNSRMQLDPAMLDDASLPAHFLVWLVSKEARFLKGRYVCVNWDVTELMAKANEIEHSRALELNVHGFPYGGAMLDAVLAPKKGGKEEEEGGGGKYRNVM